MPNNIPVFGAKCFTKVLISFGFDIDYKRGKGGHALAKHPTINPYPNQRPFIIIKGDKEYRDPFFRSELIKQIKSYGFDRDEIIKRINKFKC